MRTDIEGKKNYTHTRKNNNNNNDTLVDSFFSPQHLPQAAPFSTHLKINNSTINAERERGRERECFLTNDDQDPGSVVIRELSHVD